MSTRLQFTWEAAGIMQVQLYKHAGSRADGSDPPTEVFSPPTPATKYCLISSPTGEHHDRSYWCARGSSFIAPHYLKLSFPPISSTNSESLSCWVTESQSTICWLRHARTWDYHNTLLFNYLWIVKCATTQCLFLIHMPDLASLPFPWRHGLSFISV